MAYNKSFQQVIKAVKIYVHLYRYNNILHRSIYFHLFYMNDTHHIQHVIDFTKDCWLHWYLLFENDLNFILRVIFDQVEVGIE